MYSLTFHAPNKPVHETDYAETIFVLKLIAETVFGEVTWTEEGDKLVAKNQLPQGCWIEISKRQQ